MKKLVPKISIGLLITFGLVTLLASTSIIFDLFEFRANEGNFVWSIVYANFICGFIYLFAAYGWMKNKTWTTKLLGIATLILIAAFIGLFFHINSGGIYETKTIDAMVFRTSVTLIFTLISYFIIKKNKQLS